MRRTRAFQYAVLMGVVLPCYCMTAGADEQLPSPKPARQVVPRGNATVGAPPEVTPQAINKGPKSNDAAKEDASPDAAKSKTKKPLIASPSLLSQAPLPRTSAVPGLGKLDLNRATLDQIQRLPGVGLTWAPRILAGRPYRSLGDLARDGIPFPAIDALSQQVELGP